MRSLDREYYLPIMVMVLIQFIYAGLSIGTRIALLQGMSPRVFVVYRHAFATIILAPLAYLSSRYHHLYISILNYTIFPSHVKFINKLFFFLFLRENLSLLFLKFKEFFFVILDLTNWVCIHSLAVNILLTTKK
jgi:hypothetical protein